MFVLAAALKEGFSVDRLYELTKIDRWFLYKMKNIVTMSTKLQGLSVDGITTNDIWGAKKLGFSDKQVGSKLFFNFLLNNHAFSFS